MTKFTFPALAAGPPSRRNWYKELLDDPNCAGDPVRVQEAYETHRATYSANQLRAFINHNANSVTPDEALIKHLKRQSTGSAKEVVVDDLYAQDVNCLVIWARPPPSVLTLIQTLQKRVALLAGSDLHLMPSRHLHLSVIELSHWHSVQYLRNVLNEIGPPRILTILNLLSRLPNKPKLVSPQLSFDKMGIALNFVPAQDDAYTYHHLRGDMHALALESGVAIDMCYTAPLAHVTLGRFIGNAFFEQPEARSRFVHLIETVNEELRSKSRNIDSGDGWEWTLGENTGLELQLGYLKFGRERELADIGANADACRNNI